MESHWIETSSCKNSFGSSGPMTETEKYGSLLLPHQNLITGGTLEIVQIEIPEEIIPKILEGMSKVKKQMHRIAVH